MDSRVVDPIRPCRTSLIVPSPPEAITSCQPLCAASLAIRVASFGPVVSRVTTSTFRCFSNSTNRSIACLRWSGLPRPAFGFAINKSFLIVRAETITNADSISEGLRHSWCLHGGRHHSISPQYGNGEAGNSSFLFSGESWTVHDTCTVARFHGILEGSDFAAIIGRIGERCRVFQLSSS